MDSSSLSPGHLLRGRFRITGVLGRGGMGVVYEALDLEDSTHVALKAVKGSSSAEAVYHLKREFRVLADLHHPNLVRLGELFGERDEWFFTMERVTGVDLVTWIRGGTAGLASAAPNVSMARRGGDERSAERPIPSAVTRQGFSEQRLRAALAQLAQGVAAMHAAGHVHRDLKPSNVLVTPEGRVVLIDFGIARSHLGSTTATRRAIEGTVAYMAPEQASDAEVGQRADWYSVGVMLFEAITGVLPHDGPPARVLARKAEEAPPWPSTIVPCAPDIDALVVELLAPEPEERPDIATILRVAGAGSARFESHETLATTFVGRAQELEALRDAFERRARPSVLRVVGESGVGKSALVRRFLDELREQSPGLVQLAGRCYANELVPYKAWDGVIDALTRHLRRMEVESGAAHLAWHLPRNARALARVFPMLERVSAIANLVTSEGPLVARSPDRLRGDAFDALRELLRGLAQSGPVVIAIDDWQWADRDSHLLFDDLTLHPDAPPIVLVVTQRDEATAPPHVGLETRITLGRLSETETRELAATLGKGELGGLDDLARESGGHPMFLQQLVHQLGTKRRVSRLDDVIRERANELPGDARRVLELICVAGVPLSRGVLQVASGLDPGRCATAIDALETAQLVRSGGEGHRLEPWHDRIREAVEASLAPAARAGAHAALADALSHAPDDDESSLGVVRHLAAAGQAERAAQAAIVGARRADEALAFDRAAELYRLALELGRHGADDLELRLALSNSLSNAGRGALEAAQGFLAAADATADGDRALELRTRALEQLSISGHVSQALDLLSRLCRDVGVSLPRTRFGIVLAYFWHRVRLRIVGLPARVDGTAPPRSAAEHRLYMTAFMHLPLIDPLLANWLHARTLILALRTRDRAMLGLCLCREAGISLTFDANRMDHALRASQLAHTLFDGDPDIDHRAWLVCGHAIRCYFTGRFQTAVALFREAEAIWGTEVRNYVAHLSQIAVFVLGCQRYLGRIEALRRELMRVRRDAAWRGNTYLEVTSTLASNVAVLLQDGPEAALTELGRIDEGSQLGGSGANEWYVLRGHTEIELHRGATAAELERRERELRATSRKQIAWVVTFGAEIRALEARVILARADRGERSGLGRAARIARKLRKDSLPYAQVYGALLEAALLLQRGDEIGARATLDTCAVESELHGYALCAAVARARLAELRGSPSDEARAYFAGEGIGDVEGALRVFAPGFRRARLLPS